MGTITNIVSRLTGAMLGVLLLSAGPANAQQTEAALADMATLANSMEVCAIDTGRYVSLESLNDGTGANPIRPYDFINDMGGAYSIIPQDGFFLPRSDLTNITPGWQGPYVSFQQDRTQTDPDPYDLGSPLDPWGSPYYLFNPFGLIRGDTGVITLELYGDNFDRYTIISLGPDGIMSSDDLSYEFGTGVTSTRLTSLRGDGVTLTSPPEEPPVYDVEAGTTVTLHGFNFGSAGPEKNALFGDVTLEVESWSNRDVVVEIPETLSGNHPFALQFGSGETNSVTATITGGNTSVREWTEY